MTRRITTILTLSLLAITFVAMTANAVKSPDESSRVINPRIYRSLQYALPLMDADNSGALNANSTRPVNDGASLGTSASSVVPWQGVKVGDTWYDGQHNGRVTRMVDWAQTPVVDGVGGFQVHFEWTRLATEVVENRHYAYNVYRGDGDNAGTFLDQIAVQPEGEYAGFVSLDLSADGRAVLGGHNNQGGGYQNHTYWDAGPGWAFLGMNARVPDSVSAWGTGQDPDDSLKSCIWPSICYQDIPGKADPVLHVFTQTSEPGAGDPQAVIYFRKVGANETGVWDYPPYVVDTVFDIAQDVVCSYTTGKVALVWVANLPDVGDCDTCSSQEGWPFVQLDNDLYYQLSDDYGASWDPRINVTQNVDGEAGYRPYTDLQALITSDDDLHIAWSGRTWPADANSGGQAGLLSCSMFHWGENLDPGNIRMAASIEWDQTECNGGAWQMNGSKMGISECEGKLYYVWVQFNDIPKNIEDDCNARAFGAGGDASGSANGELYLAVSADMGLTWDAARNLTNTRTPGCDSATGVGGECRSEQYPSMARFGTANVGANMGGSVILDPGGSPHENSSYIDLMYIADPDPGNIMQDEGTWQQSDVRWFRMPCVEPVPTPAYVPSWQDIDFPEYTKHGTQYIKPLVITNTGNTNTTANLVLNEDPGPHTGWLTAEASIGFGGDVTIESGTNNTVEGNVYINANLAINAPGTIVHLSGNMTATGNFTSPIPSPYVYPIDFWVTDSIIFPTFDTITTGCFDLVVSNMGNWGNQGAGQVNLDYYNYGDCDGYIEWEDEPGNDTIPGDAEIYAYDASPVICWTDIDDTVRCNWSIFGQGYQSDYGFFPDSNKVGVKYYTHDTCTEGIDDSTYIMDGYYSRFSTRDTGILIEKWWWLPAVPTYQDDDGSNFIIQVLKISIHPDADGDEIFTGLNIGEAIDWDIPSDSASRNRGGFDAPNKLVYQQGSEWVDSLGDLLECMDNDNRYGGIELLGIQEVDGGVKTETSEPYGAYTGSNSLWVYPEGGFLPSQLDSLMTAREGYVSSDSIDADLHSTMTFKSDYTLTPTKTIWIFKCLITTRVDYAAFIAAAEDCHAFYAEYLKEQYASCGCCIGIRGNIDGDPADAIDISDLVYLVDYMFSGGPPAPCFEESDLDASLGLDISDLVYLVDYMFTGGPPPLDCIP